MLKSLIITAFLACASIHSAYAQSVFGVYWNGMEEIFASLDPETGVLTDISVLPGVTSIQNRGIFDSKSNRYIILTNLGITVVNALDGSIISTIPNDINFLGLVFGPSNNVFGVYFDGAVELFTELDLQTGTFNDIAVLPGVQSIQNIASYDRVQNRYFIITNLGILTIDASSGSILQSIDLDENVSGLEFDCENSLYGVYFEGVEFFTELDLATESLNDIAVLPGVQRIQFTTAYDALINRYYINTNLGFTVIDPSSGAIVNSFMLDRDFSAIAAENMCSSMMCGAFPWDGN